MDKQQVIYKDLGIIGYKDAWDYQEGLLRENVLVKSEARTSGSALSAKELPTNNYFLFCEHHPVYTLGNSGNIGNVLLSEGEMAEKGISFFKTNRGGDITFHGLQQIVGYPILDLEKFYTDIGRYLRNIEETIIRTIAEYGIKGERSNGETGVWVDPLIPGRERKIAAIGVRCSRWITMHGFALNVNTNLDYFNNIIPCGIANKQVTSLEKETGYKLRLDEVKEKLLLHFSDIFDVEFS